MNKENLKAVMQQQVERGLPQLIPRQLSLPTDAGKVVCLTGARRTGKTFMLYQTAAALLAQGIERERLLYLNFEDDRLYPVGADELDLILRAHRELFPAAADQRRYLFLDEVQNIAGWERYVRRIYDTEDVTVFVTGSSSALLQRDMSTAMRGRSITYEIFPLSFSEFLTFRDLEYRPHSADSQADVVHAFHEYLAWGGFPEVVLAEGSLKLKILQEYAMLMLHRDLIERYHIRNERLMRLLLKFCAEHTGSLLSLNKLYNDLTSQGLKFSKATLYEYMHTLEDAWVVFSAPKYDPSSRRQMQAPRKIHMLDPGLTRTYHARPERNIGHRFESLVYMHLRRRHDNICYHRNSFEIDLCWDEGAHFVNVVWDLADHDTATRELKACDAGRKLWPHATARLVHALEPPPDNAPTDLLVPGWQYLLTP